MRCLAFQGKTAVKQKNSLVQIDINPLNLVEAKKKKHDKHRKQGETQKKKKNEGKNLKKKKMKEIAKTHITIKG